jgi:hypothetical protein
MTRSQSGSPPITHFLICRIVPLSGFKVAPQESQNLARVGTSRWHEEQMGITAHLNVRQTSIYRLLDKTLLLYGGDKLKFVEHCFKRL